MDYGAPRSFLDIGTGVDVVSADGHKIGTLEHVLADEQTDILDGIVIDVRPGPGGHRFVDAPQIEAFFERAIVVTIAAVDAEQLPEPPENPAVVEHGGAEDSESLLPGKLRRAWDRISGRY